MTLHYQKNLFDEQLELKQDLHHQVVVLLLLLQSLLLFQISSVLSLVHFDAEVFSSLQSVTRHNQRMEEVKITPLVFQFVSLFFLKVFSLLIAVYSQ
jgi:hypothetical protein